MVDAPDWYAPENAPPSSSPATGGVPDWYAPEPAQVAPAVPAPPPAPVMKPSGSDWKDAYNFLRTAATKGFGSMAGALLAAPNPLQSALGLDPPDLASYPQKIPAALFKATAPEYQPQTTPGKYGMAAAEFALPAALGEPEAAIPNMLRGAAAGAASKGASDAGLPGWLGPVATTLTEFLARKGAGIVTPSMSSGADAKAGQIAGEVGAVPSAAPALPGLRLTNGQLSGNQGWLALDRDMGDNAAAQRDNAASLAANKAVISGSLDGVAPGPTGADAAVAQTGGVEAARKAAKKTADDAWAAIPPDVSVDTAPLKTALDQHVAGVTEAGDDDLLPMAQINRLKDLPDNAPIAALQARRSRLGTDASDAYRNGNTNSGRVIKNVADILGAHIDDETNIVTGNAGDLDSYKAARAATEAYHSTFGDDNKAGAQVADLTAGKIAPESGLARFLPPGNEGTGTQSLSRLKATGADLTPARSYLVGKLKDAVEAGPDAFSKVLDTYGYAFKDKALFTPAQQATFEDARDAVAQTYRKAEPGADMGSPTFDKLNGPSFAHALYGRVIGTAAPAAAKMIGSGVGSLVTKALGIPGAEEIPGQLFAGEGAGNIATNAMRSARDKVFATLDAARKDPALARQLQMKASAANLKMAPQLRNMIKTLGVSEAQALPDAPGSQP